MTRPKPKFWLRVGVGRSRRRRRKKSYTPQKANRITPSTHPSEWAAWMRYYRDPHVKMRNFAHYCEQEGYVSVPSLYPAIEKEASKP
jgi:hypothetical protein